MESLLEAAWSMATRGMAFNVITSYADFYRPGNFYADLSELQLFVVRRLSRFIKIDCTYPLFEASLCVLRADNIRSKYGELQFSKYLEND